MSLGTVWELEELIRFYSVTMFILYLFKKRNDSDRTASLSFAQLLCTLEGVSAFSGVLLLPSKALLPPPLLL